MLYDTLAKLPSGNQKAALCIVVATHGSAPRRPGAKMIVFEDGRILGTIGGGRLEEAVIRQALEAIKTGKPVLNSHELLQQHGMCCGGSVDIYIEPIMPVNRLYIFGAGHIGRALAFYATPLDFDITVIDDRKNYLDQLGVDGVNTLHVDPKEALPALPFDEHTFIVIVTYDHQLDRDILSYCIKKPFAYCGMIGSLRKVKMTEKIFLEGKIATKAELKKVDMPMGVDIAAESAEEIAISILARLIQVKNEAHAKR